MTLTITTKPQASFSYIVRGFHDCTNETCLALFYISHVSGHSLEESGWLRCITCDHCLVEPRIWAVPMAPSSYMRCVSCLIKRGDVPNGYGGFQSQSHARMFHLLREFAAGRTTATLRPFPGDLPVKKPYTGPKGVNKFAAIKAAVRLEEFAGRYTDLLNGGPNKMKGCCPLHKELTPSFHIWLDKQTWRCFGACAVGGDVITLAQEIMDRRPSLR